MTSLSPTLRRILAVSLLVVAALAIYDLLVGPLVDGYTNNRRVVDQLMSAEARYEAIGREGPAIAKQLDAVRAQSKAAAGYLHGANETLVAAELQDRLKTAVSRTGGQLKSTQVVTSAETAKSHRIVVRGTMAVTLASLQRVLYEIESGTPYLFVENLDIHPLTSPRAGDPAAAALLDVRLDVYGYMGGET